MHKSTDVVDSTKIIDDPLDDANESSTPAYDANQCHEYDVESCSLHLLRGPHHQTPSGVAVTVGPAPV
jgi:hypothetical protein